MTIKEKPIEEIKSRRTHIVWTESEYQELKERADNAGLTVSAYVRQVAIYGKKKGGGVKG